MYLLFFIVLSSWSHFSSSYVPTFPILRYQSLSRSIRQTMMKANTIEPKVSLRQKLSNQFKESWNDAKANPFKYLTIPLSAAIIGYITNWVGVKMLFYPIEWLGIPIRQWEQQPLGLIGWQGIVPAKRILMSSRLVDVTLTKLINVAEIFRQLNPTKMTELLSKSLGESVEWIPTFISNIFLKKSCIYIINQSDKIIDLKTIVVNGLTKDPRILGQFFQKVAYKELNFLIDSGFGFGFLLGCIQMLQWMIYPKDWTMVAGGALVGYVTNWLALKWIFEPLNPTKIGPFIIQGMFLKRQKEVTIDFCNFLCDKVITSKNIWNIVLNGKTTQAFTNILQKNVPLPLSIITSIVYHLRNTVGNLDINHPLHNYIDITLRLKTILIQKMNMLSTAEFEQIIHPIFQEDEMTLILSGAVLGGLSGLLQVYANKYFENRKKKKELLLLSQQQQQQQQEQTSMPNTMDIQISPSFETKESINDMIVPMTPTTIPMQSPLYTANNDVNNNDNNSNNSSNSSSSKNDGESNDGLMRYE